MARLSTRILSRTDLAAVILALLMTCSRGVAAPPAPPLQTFSTIIPDAIGSQIQNQMVWTGEPYDPRVQTYFVAFRSTYESTGSGWHGTLNLFADARYMLWVNGDYAERGPARFQPNGPEYDAIDLSKLSHPGTNSLCILVMANASGGKIMRHSPGLGAVISQDATGAGATVPTWKWSKNICYKNASVAWPNITETMVDATAEDGDWQTASYDDNQWKQSSPIDGKAWGTLTARRIPRLRETPVAVVFDNGAKFPLEMKPGDKLSFTCPGMVQAYTRLELDADPGSVLTLDHAGITYKAKAGKQTFISFDTKGFLKGGFELKSGRVTLNKVDIIERLYPYDLVANFHSNDETLNKLWALCARSGQLLTEDSFVDCADRERVEWMDDDPPGNDIVTTEFSAPGPDGKPCFADPRIEHEMIRRTALTLQPEGWVKAHTCSDRYDVHAKMEDRACDWIEGIRRYYDATHDAAAVREVWPAVQAQLKYFMDRRTARGLVLCREWVVWGNPVGYIELEGAGMNAFVYKSLVDASFLAHEIQQNGDAAAYAQDARQLARNFNETLWNEQLGTYDAGYYEADESNAAAAKDAPGSLNKAPKNVGSDHLVPASPYPAIFALDQGIVPADRRERVMNYLIANKDFKGRLMIYYYACKLLYQADKPELDKLILDWFRTRWLGMINGPNGCSWEEFGGGSHAHIYGMYPGYFLNAYVLGVRRDDPVAYRTLLIEPHFGDLTHVEGKVVTEFGPVSVTWNRTADRLEFQIETPQGIATKLSLPDERSHETVLINGRPATCEKVGHRLRVNIPAGMVKGSLQ